jgi:hypothetical protein
MDKTVPEFSPTNTIGNPILTKIEDLPEDKERKELPVPRNPYMDLSGLTKLAKVVMGKDLSKFSLPVFINEPLTIL